MRRWPYPRPLPHVTPIDVCISSRIRWPSQQEEHQERKSSSRNHERSDGKKISKHPVLINICVLTIYTQILLSFNRNRVLWKVLLSQLFNVYCLLKPLIGRIIKKEMKRVGRKARLVNLNGFICFRRSSVPWNNDNDVKVKKNATTLKPRNCKHVWFLIVFLCLIKM